MTRKTWQPTCASCGDPERGKFEGWLPDWDAPGTQGTPSTGHPTHVLASMVSAAFLNPYGERCPAMCARRKAIHEAGHALALYVVVPPAYRLRHPVAWTSIDRALVPATSGSGMVVSFKRFLPPAVLERIPEALDLVKLALALGGYAAELVAFGELNRMPLYGQETDSTLAVDMLTRITGEERFPKAWTETIQALVLRLAKLFVLPPNRTLLEHTATELLKRGTLTTAELQKIFRKHPPLSAGEATWLTLQSELFNSATLSALELPTSPHQRVAASPSS